MSAATETDRRSAECTLAQQQPEYADLHGACRQTEDVELPHSHGILVVHRCTCTCHRGRPE